MNVYSLSSHATSANMIWPGLGTSPHPRKARSGGAGMCLNCHTPHGIKGSATTVYDDSAIDATFRAGVSATKQGGLTVPYLIPRQLIAWQEALCLNCHDVDGPSTKNIKDDIKKSLPNSGAGPYGEGGSGHPIFDTNVTGTFTNSIADFGGRHDLANEANPTTGTWNAYSNNTRHVECFDCHNPHAVRSGTMMRKSGEGTTGRDVTVGPVALSGPLTGMWGVSVTPSTGVVTGVKRPADYIYEVCLKCHSIFADSTLGTPSGPTLPSIQNRLRWDKGGQGVGDSTTHIYMPWAGIESNVADDYKTNHDAYHPVFALGKNQPSSTANPRWGSALNCCGSCASPVSCTMSGSGLVTNATLQPAPEEEFRLSVTTFIKKRGTGKRVGAVGFENNFVPPWGPNAYVTCVDCHESESETNPRGPHGSSRPFILRKLDTGITYTIENDVINQTETGQRVVSYSSFSYGVNGKSSIAGATDNFIGTVNLEQWDANNICINCHRADVYGFYRQSIGWSGASQASCGDPYPRFRYLSRQPHPADGGCSGSGAGKGNSFDAENFQAKAGYPPRGIVCLRCHGGNSPGAIHGNDSFDGPGYIPGNPSSSKGHLLYGTVWTDYTPGSTTVKGGCVTGGAATLYNACTHNAQGEFDTIAMYNY